MGSARADRAGAATSPTRRSPAFPPAPTPPDGIRSTRRCCALADELHAKGNATDATWAALAERYSTRAAPRRGLHRRAVHAASRSALTRSAWSSSRASWDCRARPPSPRTVDLSRVSLLVTCVVDLFEPDVGVAAVRVLRAAGCDVSCPPARRAAASRRGTRASPTKRPRSPARRSTRSRADGGDAVVVPAGSCATMIRVFWPELFEVVGDHDAAARARRLGASARGADRAARRAASLRRVQPSRRAACRLPPLVPHAARAARRTTTPLALLERVDGCETVDWSADERCCGFGGTFS